MKKRTHRTLFWILVIFGGETIASLLVDLYFFIPMTPPTVEALANALSAPRTRIILVEDKKQPVAKPPSKNTPADNEILWRGIVRITPQLKERDRCLTIEAVTFFNPPHCLAATANVYARQQKVIGELRRGGVKSRLIIGFE
jgi:hypothetical protein